MSDDLELREMLEPVWFRVEARHWASFNDSGDADGHYSELIVTAIPVEKHTPKGAWLWGKDTIMGRKFVLRDYQHRGRAYAASTIDQAKEDFRKRKQYRINRLQAQINRAEQEITFLDRGQIRLITYDNKS